MKVYITYDRYEHDEWYNIFYVGTNYDQSVKHCKEVDLPDFISCGPDDCHSFQLQEVEMTKEQYETFKKWIEDGQSLENYGDESSDLFNFMVNIYDDVEVVETIFSTDGCSDFYDIIKFYGQMKGIDPEDFEDVEDDLQDELCEDDDLRIEVIKKYVELNY